MSFRAPVNSCAQDRAGFRRLNRIPFHFVPNPTTDMDYLTRKNDRRRRRRARAITFLITAALTLAFAHQAGILEELPAVYEQLFGPELGDAPVAGV